MDIEKLREEIDAILEAGDMFLKPPDDLAEFIDSTAVKVSRTDQVLAKVLPLIEQKDAEIQALHRERNGEVWYWLGDGYDHPENLTCPILIEPGDFMLQRDFMFQLEQARKEERERIITILQELIELSEKVKEPSIKVKMMSVLEVLQNKEVEGKA